jgi:photosystem II stability/assembly factor-like uncharacterized protein
MQFRLTKARIIQLLLACLCFFAPLILALNVPRASMNDAWRPLGMEGSKVAEVYALRRQGESQYLCTTVGLGVWHFRDLRWSALNTGLPMGAWSQVPTVHLAAQDGDFIRLYLGLGDRSDSVGFYSQSYPSTWLLLRSDFGRDIIGAIAFEPDASVVYAATTRGFYRSADRGQTWRNLSGPALASAPTVLVVHPRKPGELWLGTSVGEVYISTDRGETWRLAYKLPLERKVNSIALDPVEPEIAYMAAGASVYVTKDGGEIWDRQSFGLGSGFAVSLLVDPAVRGGVFLASNPDGVYRSENYGRLWVPFREGMGRMGVNSLALDPLDNETLLAGTDNGVWIRSLDWLRSGVGVEIPPPFTPTPLPARSSPTPMLSPTPTATRTRTPSATATATLLPPTHTPTSTRMLAGTLTLTPMPSATPTSTLTVVSAETIPPPGTTAPGATQSPVAVTATATRPTLTPTTAPSATPTRPPR